MNRLKNEDEGLSAEPWDIQEEAAEWPSGCMGPDDLCSFAERLWWKRMSDSGVRSETLGK